MFVVNFLDDRLPPRFWAKCSPEPNSGCWLWFGATKEEGYGFYALGTRAQGREYAHRVAYVALVGTVPVGLELDHLCRTRCCVNPAHLEAVTHRENVRRGDARFNGAENRAKTHCPQGHPYAGDNLIVHGRKRSCAECSRRQQRVRRHLAKQQRKAS